MLNTLFKIAFTLIVNLVVSSFAFADSGSALNRLDKKSLQDIVAKTAKEMGVPGAFVLLRTPQGEFNIAYGTTYLKGNTRPSAKTHFRIASVTKTMTAAVIVQQAEEKRLSLSDPVSKYLPIPNGDNITIANLLQMRSGLYNYTNSPSLADELDTHPQKVWNTKELLKIAFDQPPNFLPDAQYEYSNTNYLLLGLIAEKIDGEKLSNIFQRRLFKPLGLEGTSLPLEADRSLHSPYSHGYHYVSSIYALVDKSYSKEVQSLVRSNQMYPLDYTFLNPSYALAAGGVTSTAHDLANWIEALVKGELFQKNYPQWLASLKPEYGPDSQKYGYGIVQINFRSNDIYFHGGECPGYNTFAGHDPANKVTLVVWTNLAVSIHDQLTANTIMNKLLERIYKNP